MDFDKEGLVCSVKTDISNKKTLSQLEIRFKFNKFKQIAAEMVDELSRTLPSVDEMPEELK